MANTSKLETAKELLRKGLALGDEEIIRIANSLIDDAEPEPQKELWYCNKCSSTFKNPKKKKSCPNCKGRKIAECPIAMPAYQEPTPIKQNNDDPYAEFRIKKNEASNGNRIEIDPDTGEQKNYGKKGEIRVGNSITAEELANLHKDDTEFDKKVFRGIEPRRKPFKMIKVKCSRCSKEVEASPLFTIGSEGPKQNFICDRCSRKGI